MGEEGRNFSERMGMWNENRVHGRENGRQAKLKGEAIVMRQSSRAKPEWCMLFVSLNQSDEKPE